MNGSIVRFLTFFLLLFSFFSTCFFVSNPLLTDDQYFEKMSSEDFNSTANFNSSGESGIAVSGEPAFLGDALRAAVLVSNYGNSSGSVDLNLEHLSSGQLFIGENVLISPGSTREVPVIFSPVENGLNVFRWWISSDGGNTSSTLSGELSIQAYQSQNLELYLDSYEWSKEEGLTAHASVYLSPGNSRDIELIISKQLKGETSTLQSVLVKVDPGKRDLHFELGHPQLDSVHIDAIPIGWSPSNSIISASISAEVPSLDPSLLMVETTFTPQMPSPGERVVAKISLINSENFQADAGKVRIILSSEKTILAETSVQSVNSGSTVTTDVPIQSWPSGERVELEVLWTIGEVTSTSFFSVNSEVEDSFMNAPFDIVSAGYGILAGVMSIMVGTLVWRAVSSRTPTTSKEGLRETKESSESQARKLKTEISCTHCDQRLMVPSGHVGGVRCPSCSMEFKVGGGSEKSEIVVRSSEDTLNCPDCDQALRVPIEKRPAMSRCPVCKTEFMAEAEVN